MTAQSPDLEAEKQEVLEANNSERTRECPCFIPRADIYELDDKIVIVADVPGADENSIDITLEKNILTINAYVEPTRPEGYSLAYGEYEQGDYQRSFRLSNEVDQEHIEAQISDGVLYLGLPKAGALKTRKISVKAG
jgi:HSP20 family protein